MSSTSIRLASPEDAHAIAAVRIEAWRTTYRGMIPDAYLAGMKVEDSASLWERVLTAPPNTTNTFVAETSDTMRGFASSMMLAEPRHGFDAELSAIYVVPASQRRGIGRQLLGAVTSAQRALGATGMIVWVIAANRAARQFYQALGAELVIEQPFQWDGMDLIEAGYGWRDLDALIEVCGPIRTTLH